MALLKLLGRARAAPLYQPHGGKLPGIRPLLDAEGADDEQQRWAGRRAATPRGRGGDRAQHGKPAIKVVCGDCNEPMIGEPGADEG
jgi:hypothetical protein